MVSALTMHSLWDDLLEAVWHWSHACYYPLETQLLLKLENRSSMLIQKGFSSACWRHSHFMDHTNGESFRVRAWIGLIVSARSCRNLDMYCTMLQRRSTAATSVGAGILQRAYILALLAFTPSFVILWPWNLVISVKPVCRLSSFRTIFFSQHTFSRSQSVSHWLSICASSIVWPHPAMSTSSMIPNTPFRPPKAPPGLRWKISLDTLGQTKVSSTNTDQKGWSLWSVCWILSLVWCANKLLALQASWKLWHPWAWEVHSQVLVACNAPALVQH